MSYARSGYPSHGTDGRNPYRLTPERVAQIMREIEEWKREAKEQEGDEK